MHLRPFSACCLLAPLVMLSLGVGCLHGASLGMIVVNEGTTTKPYSKCLEYSAIAYYGMTYRVTPLNGGEHGGLAAHILADVSYTDVSKAQLAHMEATAAAYVYAEPILKPRIAALKNQLANLPPGPPGLEKPTIPFVRDGDRTYRNVRPGKLRDGLMSFFHDTGVFSTPAEPFTLRTLKYLAELNPDLNSGREFQQLVRSFVPILYFNDTDYLGVKVLSLSNAEVVLQTDAGTTRLEPSKIPAFAWKQLDAAKESERAMYTEIAARKHEEQMRNQNHAPVAASPRMDAAGETLVKGLTVVAAAAVAWWALNTFFDSSASPPETTGESQVQNYLSNRWGSGGSQEHDREAESLRSQTAASQKENEYWNGQADKRNTEWFDQQKVERDRYFDERKANQGY